MAKKQKPADSTEPAQAVDPNSLAARRRRAVEIATKQVEESIKFKQPRMNDVKSNEDVMGGKPRPALKNRFNVPFDTIVMQGALDTALAKSDDTPKLSFTADEEEYKRSSMKVTAAFEKESGDAKGRWASKDRLAKSMAYLSGRAIFEKYTYYDEKMGYCDVLNVEDHYNFQCEPGGGKYLEDHLFCGTINNFFGEEQLRNGGEGGTYDKSEVNKLFNGVDDQQQKKVRDEFDNIKSRFRSLGLDLGQHEYVGQKMFNLVKWEMEFEGERVYMLFDPHTGACPRFVPLKEIEPTGRYTWVSWATHESNIFWSRAYADTYRVTGEIYRVLVNSMLENIQKRNWGSRAYDPSVFTDSAKLLYSPDGLVKANLKPGMTSVAQGIFELQTPETTGVTLNAIEWLNSFLGQNTGITAGSQGSSDQTKVGIYYGDMQQVADRFGLLNRQYLQAWIDLGVLFDSGLYNNMPEKYMVKIVGLEGVGFEELKKEDVEPEYQVTIVSVNATAAETEVKTKKREAALTLITGNPLLLGETNKRWVVEEILRNAGYEDEGIRVGMDTQTDSNREVLLRAAESIRKIVDGEWPIPLVYSATTGFMQKIVDFANEHSGEFPMGTFHNLMIYAQAHQKIVVENMTRKAMTLAAAQGTPSTALALPPGSGVPTPTAQPTPSPLPAQSSPAMAA